MNHLAVRERLPVRLQQWAGECVSAELCYGIDPFLMAAIIDRESLGGEALKPRGPAGKGDGGHGHGLAQIDDRFHHAFLVAVFPDGKPLWQDPAFCILYGARLLAKTRDRFGQGTNALWAAIAAYNCGENRVRVALSRIPPEADDAQRIAALDSLTTGKNYLSDVLRRWREFRAAVPTDVC